MPDLSDETLVAYVDGELDPVERARVAELVDASPEAEARVAVFASTRKQLAAAFHDVLDEPVPQRLIDAVATTSPARLSLPAAPRAAHSSPGAGWLQSFGWLFAPSALALASTALVAGLGGWYVGRTQTPPSRATALEADALATGTLANALESVAGSTSLTATGTPAIRLRMTFKSRDGWCRQFEADRPAGSAVAGVACRDAAGRWHIRAFASLPTGPAGSDSIRPAAPDGAAMLSNVVDRMIEGDALDARDEADLIAAKWRR